MYVVVVRVSFCVYTRAYSALLGTVREGMLKVVDSHNAGELSILLAPLLCPL